MKRKPVIFAIIVATLISLTGLTQSQEEKSDFPVLKGPYLGQKLPGKKAVLFAPEVITYEVHESPSISSDEKEIIISSMSEGLK